MWQYRELVKNLTVSELKNKYQNTSLGFFWTILSPLLLALVLYFVFRNLFAEEENFAVNLLVGIMAWRFFANGTMTCLVSVVYRPSLVTKVYIPREILTLSAALSSLVSSTLEFIVLLPIIFVLTGSMPVTVLLFPVIHLLYFIFSLGVGLLLSALFVYFRDVNQIWEVLLGIIFWVCPIVYPLYLIGPKFITYYMLNPLTRLIITYRDVMVSGTVPSGSDFLIVTGYAVGALIIGYYVFGRLQRRFAEAI